MAAIRRAAARLGASSRINFLCCDVQERFVPLIHNMDSVLYTARLLVAASGVLGDRVSLFATQQYTKALGPTVGELKLDAVPHQLFEKKRFSMLTDELKAALDVTNPVVIFGIETHVCIQQTVLDILSDENNGGVFVVTDGVSSQRPIDRSTALQRMQAAGAVLTTGESLLFELIESADNKDFKAISNLCKEPRPNGFLSNL